jgi:hypothetical protein
LGWWIGKVPIIKHETQDEFSQSLEAWIKRPHDLLICWW